MSLGFKPTVKSINIVKENLTKITLEVNNDSLRGKYDDLQKLSNKTVQVIMLPEFYTYVQKHDRSTKKPIQEWIINTDGTTELRTIEQTQLDVDGKGNIDIQEITKKVDKELIDEYIMNSTTLEFPGNINPRDVVSRLNNGEDLGEIADSYEMSDAALLGEVEKARQHFAPFADAWDKVRDEVVFKEKAEEPEEPAAADETDQVASDPVEDDKETEEPAKVDSDEKAADSDDEKKPEGKNIEPDVKAAEDDSDSEDGDVDPYA